MFGVRAASNFGQFGPSRTDRLSTRSGLVTPNEVRRLKKILAPLLLALLAVSLMSAVYADENSGDQGTGEQENEEERMERKLDIFTSPEAIMIRSEVENGNVENHFGLLFTTRQNRDPGFVRGIVIHVAFSHETEVGDVENEAFLHLRIAYIALTEFNDANGNGALDAG